MRLPFLTADRSRVRSGAALARNVARKGRRQVGSGCVFAVRRSGEWVRRGGVGQLHPGLIAGAASDERGVALFGAIGFN